MTRNQRKWWYGLLSGFLGGMWSSIDSGLAVMIIAPKEFNLDDGLRKTLLTMLVLGLLSGAKIAVALLKQSPLPPMNGDTEVFTQPHDNNNNMKIIIAITLALALTYLKTHAAEAPPPIKTSPTQLFRAGEVDLDLYGTASIANQKRSTEDVNLGAGVGLTYWATRNFGFGLRGESEDFAHSAIDRSIGRLTVRAPLWDHVAPYGFADGGYNFERNRWLAGAGGGLEWRLKQGVGFFAEAGLAVDGEGHGLMRGAAGVRIPF